MAFTKLILTAFAGLMALPAHTGDMYVTPECTEDAYVVSLWARCLWPRRGSGLTGWA